MNGQRDYHKDGLKAWQSDEFHTQQYDFMYVFSKLQITASVNSNKKNEGQ